MDHKARSPVWDFSRGGRKFYNNPFGYLLGFTKILSEIMTNVKQKDI